MDWFQYFIMDQELTTFLFEGAIASVGRVFCTGFLGRTAVGGSGEDRRRDPSCLAYVFPSII